MATGMGRKKKSNLLDPQGPAAPASTPSTNSTSMPSWMSGESPTPSPRKKKMRIDSGGQLSRNSMRMA
ncbi:MAG: hypothetical protein ABSA33_05315 [Candidatus Micrarchaeaceae archaeon]|jgi:hypothetical protein